MINMEPGGEAAEPAPQSRTEALKDQIDEVTNVLKVNVEKMLEREDKLDNVSAMTEEIRNEAENFKRTTQNVSRTYWWKNVKLIVVVVVIILIILLIIILLATGVIPTKATETPKP